MKKTRWIKFLGASNLLFTLVVVILLGVIFYLFNKINYIFTPILVITSNILLPLVIAILLQYLFSPLIDFLEKHKVKRLYGVLLLYLLVIGITAVAAAFIYPVFEKQIISFISNFPSFIDKLVISLETWFDTLVLNTDLAAIIQEGKQIIATAIDDINLQVMDGFTGLTSVLSGITNVIVTLLLVPVILFFLLKDGQQFLKSVLKITPPKWRNNVISISSSIDTQVGSYIKGQVLVSLALGVMMFIGFTIIGLNYNGVLAVIATFTSIIPYLGATLAFVPALIIALIDSWWMVAKLIIVWLVVQFVDGNIVQPNIMGKQLNVHPLTIIIVLIVMGSFLGVVGLVFAVPIYAILKVLVTFIFQKFKERYNAYYGDVAGEYELKPVEITLEDTKKTNSFIKSVTKKTNSKRRK